MHHPDAGKLGVKELWVQSCWPHESAYPVGAWGVEGRALDLLLAGEEEKISGRRC